MRTATSTRPDWTSRAGWAALIGAALAFPLVAANTYQVSVMTSCFISALSVVGLNLITGYTGQFNLAHGSFMAIGAYTVGILTTDHQWPFWWACAAAGVLSGVLGAVIGVISLRLVGHYFAIFTLCVGTIVYLLIEKWETLTHGSGGILAIPAPPAVGPVSFETPLGQYYLSLAALLLGMALMQRIVHSLVGASFIAVRNSEALAQAIGIPLMRTKTLAFVISVVYAGLAGALYAGNVRFIGPDLAGAHHTFDMVMVLLVGGIGTTLGPLLGTLIVTWVTQALQFLQDMRMLVFGPLLIALLILMPMGVVGTWQRLRHRRLARPNAASGHDAPRDTEPMDLVDLSITPRTGDRHA